jgi:cell cycle sensor histidine kinase DivJ
MDPGGAAVEHAIQTRDDAGLDRVMRDAEEELSGLRREMARYRSLFDSARLIVGHELAKPLTAAGGYLDLLEEQAGGILGEKERSYIAKIRAALSRLEELAESFVQLLRVEKSADLGALERVDLASLVERVRERLEDRAADVTVEIERGMGAILVRRRALEVVLDNLLSNAVKHGGSRGPIGVIASLAKERRGGSKEELLVVTVEDHGAGIPEDKIEEIFTPFVRLENGERADGLGLGLALVKSVIAIMGGEIRVRSKPGEGTAVTIVVPVTNANDARMFNENVG